MTPPVPTRFTSGAGQEATKQPLWLLGLAPLSFGLALYGVTSAVLTQNPYWYTSFTVGSFVFLGILNRLLHKDTNLPYTWSFWPRFFRLYLAYFIVGFVIDVVYGRLIGSMWIYPHFSRYDEIIHVLLIGYPFAFFSVVELFFLVRFAMYMVDPNV